MSTDFEKPTYAKALSTLKRVRGQPRRILGAVFDEVDRLRALIKSAEWAAKIEHGPDECFWCHEAEPGPHATDCPAFTPTGEVK